MPTLEALTRRLRERSGLQSKRDIGRAVGAAVAAASGGQAAPWPLGDDCAVLPDADGHLLFAIEGLVQDFVERDPWFAGYCGVMVNLSDVAAMGGRPVAVTDALWARDAERFAAVWAGMRAASERYGVPIVGGHTNVRAGGEQLAVAVVGRARRLLTSFAARPGDVLLAAIDLRGSYREPDDFWDASSRDASSRDASSRDADPERLRGDLELLPAIAEDGLARAAKDISMAGLVGTALMLTECSGVGATLDLDAIPRPPEVDLERWLRSFPSFGYLLAVSADHAETVVRRFADRGLACAAVGRIEPGARLDLCRAGETACFWDLDAEPLMSFSPPAATAASHQG